MEGWRVIVGRTTAGEPVNLPAGQAYVRSIALPQDGACLAMIGALVDGQGPSAGSGTARLWPVVYSPDGVLVTVGDAVSIEPGSGAAWHTLRVAAPGVLLPDGARIGFRVTGPSDAARLYAAEIPGAGWTFPAANGAPPDMSAAAVAGLDGLVFADVFEPWAPPEVDDDALARLPWNASQKALSTTGPLAATRRPATAGWHGTDYDREVGAFCIVRSDGPLAELVGERLRVAYRIGTLERVAYVYCHDERAFPSEVADADLSLTRRAFMALAPLSRDSAPVIVEVLA